MQVIRKHNLQYLYPANKENGDDHDIISQAVQFIQWDKKERRDRQEDNNKKTSTARG